MKALKRMFTEWRVQSSDKERRTFSAWWWGRRKREKRGYLCFSKLHATSTFLLSPPQWLCILTLRTPLDFYTSYTSSMKNTMCISPKNCFSDWKDATPWFNQTMSFLALSLRPQTHQPQSTGQEWLIKRRKALAFLKPPSPIFSFILIYQAYMMIFIHLHCIPSHQELHSSCQLIAASKRKERFVFLLGWAVRVECK